MYWMELMKLSTPPRTPMMMACMQSNLITMPMGLKIAL